MLRAVPSTTFTAASIKPAFRSGILISTIFRSCWRVTVPTGLPLGEAAPLSTRSLGVWVDSGFHGKNLRAARRAVEDPIGQEPHLRVVAILAGVPPLGVRQIGYLPEGLQHGPAQGTAARLATARVMAGGTEPACSA